MSSGMIPSTPKSANSLFSQIQLVTPSTTSQGSAAPSVHTDEEVSLVLAYEWSNRSNLMRIRFERLLKKSGIVTTTEVVDDNCFIKVQVPLPLLYRYAELLRIHMPLKLYVKEVKDDFSKLLQMVSLIVEGKRYVRLRCALMAEFSIDRKHIFDETNKNFFHPIFKIYIANYIVQHLMITGAHRDPSLLDLLFRKNIYTIFTPHEGLFGEFGTKRYWLSKEWASYKKMFMRQPLEEIKNYFGVDVALYFGLMGIHITMLGILSLSTIFTTIIGTVFLFLKRENVLGANKTLYFCPLCENCPYEKVKPEWVVDWAEEKGALALWTSFTTSIWILVYMQLTKRYKTILDHQWGLLDVYIAPEPESRMHVLSNRFHLKKINFWTMRFAPAALSVFGLFVSIVVVLSFCYCFFCSLLYLINIQPLLLTSYNTPILFLKAMLTTVIYSFLIVLLLDIAATHIFNWLTKFEKHRTQSKYNNSFYMKKFIFQFFTNFALLTYVVFVKPFLSYIPSDLNTMAVVCSWDGCLLEVSIRLWTLLACRTIWTYAIRHYQIVRSNKKKRKTAGNDRDLNNKYIDSLFLLPLSTFDVHELYLDLTMQFTYLVLFISLIPEFPLVALVISLFEIRFRGKLFLKHYRKPMPKLTTCISLWSYYMSMVAHLSVIINPYLLAFMFPAIPKLIFNLTPDKNPNESFLEYTLASFAINDYPTTAKFVDPPPGVTECRYFGFRYPPKHLLQYKLTSRYWQILVARLVFMLFYIICVNVLSLIIISLLPEIPDKLKIVMEKENYEIEEYLHSCALKKRADRGEAHAAQKLNRKISSFQVMSDSTKGVESDDTMLPL